jgi:5-methylcytosine-specific restriction endonuclease McrA
MCRKPYRHIHEIIPKSRTKEWDRLDNRVPLCVECHAEAHQNGTRNSEEKLRVYQLKRLVEYYGDR